MIHVLKTNKLISDIESHLGNKIPSEHMFSQFLDLEPQERPVYENNSNIFYSIKTNLLLETTKKKEYQLERMVWYAL